MMSTPVCYHAKTEIFSCYPAWSAIDTILRMNPEFHVRLFRNRSQPTVIIKVCRYGLRFGFNSFNPVYTDAYLHLLNLTYAAIADRFAGYSESIPWLF